ncbi:hypothetical protein M422DRAFT_54166 [Sphaerobolus stellatus SS14]|uniref:Uncharacterized protein n=1 Tax=Sphaerobolus stellatus (strain SS14) TaxID=990650 RepID=A0A0C9U552_SPHS4|nr:hypothetical protein M422DRAFT_54166 [Sphaerobolus stellatus SS14]
MTTTQETIPFQNLPGTTVITSTSVESTIVTGTGAAATPTPTSFTTILPPNGPANTPSAIFTPSSTISPYPYTQQSPSQPTRLSSGAIIGIVAGVCSILVLVIGVLLLRRRQKNTHERILIDAYLERELSHRSEGSLSWHKNDPQHSHPPTSDLEANSYDDLPPRYSP